MSATQAAQQITEGLVATGADALELLDAGMMKQSNGSAAGAAADTTGGSGEQHGNDDDTDGGFGGAIFEPRPFAPAAPMDADGAASSPESASASPVPGPPETKRARIVSQGGSTSAGATGKTGRKTAASSSSGNNLSFPQQLMDMLSDATHSQIVSWTKNGNSFTVHSKDEFVSDVMPLYFGKKSKFTSFTRKLNRWGFARNNNGDDKGSYSHPMFRRDDPRSCLHMACGSGNTGLSKSSGGGRGRGQKNKSTSASAAKRRANEAAEVVAATEAEAEAGGGIGGGASAASALHVGLMTPHLAPHMFALQGQHTFPIMDGTLAGLSPFSGTGFSPVPLTPGSLSGLTPGVLSGFSPGVLSGLSPMMHMNAAAIQAAGLGGMAPGSAPVGLPPPPPLAGAPAADNLGNASSISMNGLTGVGNQHPQVQQQEQKQDLQQQMASLTSTSDPFGVGYAAAGHSGVGVQNVFPGMMGTKDVAQQENTIDAPNNRDSNVSSPGGISDYNAELGGTGLSPPPSGGADPIGGAGAGNASLRLIQQLQSQLNQQQQIIKNSQQIQVKANGEDVDAVLPEGAEPEPLPNAPINSASSVPTADQTDSAKIQQLQAHQSLGELVRSLSGSSAPMGAQSQPNNALLYMQMMQQQQQQQFQHQLQPQQQQPQSRVRQSQSLNNTSMNNEVYHNMVIDQLTDEANLAIGGNQ